MTPYLTPKARAYSPASPARFTPSFLCKIQRGSNPRQCWRRFALEEIELLCKIVHNFAFGVMHFQLRF